MATSVNQNPGENLPREKLEGKCDGESSVPLHSEAADRYHGQPIIMLQHPDGTTRPAPFLMGPEEVAAFFRLHESKTKFFEKTIQRYRRMGLRTVRIGRRVWFRLDDVLRFLDEQQDRLR